MKAATRIFVTLGLGLCFAAQCQTGADGLGPAGEQVPGDPVPSEQVPSDPVPGEEGSDQATPTQTQEELAQQLQQALGGQRLTYLTSNSNGNVYTSRREDHDLCSSGQFQTRIVSETSGYGGGSQDVYEGGGLPWWTPNWCWKPPRSKAPPASAVSDNTG